MSSNAKKPSRPAIQPLRPIISAATSPTHSAIPSPAMSRRSSSSGSVSGKCVHFPCNPAKMTTSFLTHSRDAYDRSPIIPSGEDLDLPSCKSEEGSWIKCLQRQAREAAKEGQAPPHTSSAPLRATTATGEFECSTSDLDAAALSSPCSEVSLPSLTHDDYSSCSETDELSNHPPSNPFNFASGHFRTPSLDMYLSLSIREEQQQKTWHSDADLVVSDDCEGEEDDTLEAEVDPTGHQARKLGMCALGKFSRKSLFENDAFGGF